MSSLFLRGLFVDIGNIRFNTGTGQQIFGVNGSTSTPFYAFSNSNDGIFYNTVGSAITFTFAGVSRFAFNNAGDLSATRFLAGSGSPTGPVYSFTGNTGTGIYSAGADILNLTTASTLRVTLNTTNLSTTLAILNQNGNVSLPAYSFTTDSTTGMFSNGAGTLAFGTSANQRLLIDTANITSTLPIIAPIGSATLPAYTFSGTTNTGIYSASAGTINLSTAGTLRVTLDSANLSSNLPIIAPIGAAATPAYSFTGRTGTGMYSSGANTINLSTAGTLRVTLDSANLSSTLPIVAPLGQESLPSYVFSGRTATGMYSSAISTINFSTAGVSRLVLNTTNLTTTLAILNQNGTASLPAYAFSVDSTTGMFSNGAGTIAFGTSATQRLLISTANITSSLAILNQSGTLALPAYSFSGDPNTGIYNPAADTVVIVGNGIQSFKTDSKNNVVIGTETALATTSTDGFLYIPSVGGTPTTAPATAYTGKVPISFDTTDQILNIYTSAKWIQSKTNYWHYEGTFTDSSTQFSDGGVASYFPGSTYYNMGVNGDLFNAYIRIKWTAKNTPTTGNLRTVFVLPATFPVVLPGTLSTIPVVIGYKEGIAFATQINAIVSMANAFGNVLMIINYLLYSQTGTNAPAYVVNADVATDGQMTLSFTVPLFQTIDPSPIAGF